MAWNWQILHEVHFQKLVSRKNLALKIKNKLPLSANIRAPASITNSPPSSSLTTAAVKPAAEEAFPLV